MIRRPPRSTRTDTRFPYTTLFRSGLVHSQRVLLALTQAGVSREDSYRYVQRNAMKVWESDGQLSLMELLKADPDVAAALTAEQIEEKFNQIGRAHVRTPVTNAHLVCRLLLEKKNKKQHQIKQ